MAGAFRGNFPKSKGQESHINLLNANLCSVLKRQKLKSLSVATATPPPPPKKTPKKTQTIFFFVFRIGF